MPGWAVWALLLDLSNATFPVIPTDTTRLYRRFSNMFPIDQPRFVALFESVIAHCADTLAWHSTADGHLPMLSINSLEDRNTEDRRTIVLSRAERGAYSIKARLPKEILQRVRNKIRREDRGSEVNYLIISNTDERNLSIFFLSEDASRRLFHVALYHDNVPGALASILGLIAAAEFNILTSLVRRESGGRSVWEALIEYRVQSQMPSNDQVQRPYAPTPEVLSWMSGVLRASSPSGLRLADCEIELGAPRYPRRPNVSDAKVPLDLPEEPGRLPADEIDLQALLHESALRIDPRSDSHDEARQVVDTVSRRLRGDRAKPAIFLSYPGRAAAHAALVRQALESDFALEEHQKPDGTVIIQEVVKKIQDADYFVGIWHHEDLQKNPTSIVSPWMHFEYGIAFAAQKRNLVVHSVLLPEYVTRRVNPGVAHPSYTDLTFETTTVPTIVKYCQENFVR